MKRNVAIVLMCALSVIAFAPGCETAGGSAGAGAGIGALAGGIIGAQSGRAWEGAAIGAAVGAVGGLIAHDVRKRRQKNAQQTYETYDYQPSTGGFQLEMEGASATPDPVAPGSDVNSKFTYAVMGAPGAITVKEQSVIKQDGKVLAKVYEEADEVQDGTYDVEMDVPFPKDVQPGTYTIAHTVSAQNKQTTSNVRVNVVTAKREDGTLERRIEVAAAE